MFTYSLWRDWNLYIEASIDANQKSYSVWKDGKWCLCQASKSIFGLVWPWRLRSSCCDLASPTNHANLHQNRFICFQTIVFKSLVTNKRTDGRTDRQVENTMPVRRGGGVKLIKNFDFAAICFYRVTSIFDILTHKSDHFMPSHRRSNEPRGRNGKWKWPNKLKQRRLPITKL